MNPNAVIGEIEGYGKIPKRKLRAAAVEGEAKRAEMMKRVSSPVGIQKTSDRKRRHAYDLAAAGLEFEDDGSVKDSPGTSPTLDTSPMVEGSMSIIGEVDSPIKRPRLKLNLTPLDTNPSGLRRQRPSPLRKNSLHGAGTCVSTISLVLMQTLIFLYTGLTFP